MLDLANEFSWSFSRHRTFHDCPRKYWFHYYGSWGGWDADAPAEARELYQLKNISNLHLVAGDVVHRALEKALVFLAQGRTTDPEDLVGWCKREMQQAMKDSRAELWRESPKQYTRLFEHHYGPAPRPEFLRKIAKKVGTSIRNFFESESYAIIKETDADEWLPLETLDTFEFEGTRVFAVPDFATRHRGEVVLMDWKTGRPDSRNNEQLVLYAMFAVAKWDVDPDVVRGAPVYLLNGGDFKPRSVSVEDRARVGDMMRTSISAMKSRLHDATTNEARKQDFEASPGHVCRSCSFRAVCPHAR